MREYFARDRSRIDALVVACGETGAELDSYLEDVHFSASSGRALILQPAGRFCYLYMAPAVFDDPRRRQAEVKALVDLLTLLASLRDRHLLVLVGTACEGHGPHVIGGRFVAKPREFMNQIILNTDGDHSVDPATILNAGGEVILKGLRIEGDLFRLIEQHAGRSAFVSQDLADMAAAWRLADVPRSRSVAMATPGQHPVPPTAPEPIVVRMPPPIGAATVAGAGLAVIAAAACTLAVVLGWNPSGLGGHHAAARSASLAAGPGIVAPAVSGRLAG